MDEDRSSRFHALKYSYYNPMKQTYQELAISSKKCYAIYSVMRGQCRLTYMGDVPSPPLEDYIFLMEFTSYNENEDDTTHSGHCLALDKVQYFSNTARCSGLEFHDVDMPNLQDLHMAHEIQRTESVSFTVYVSIINKVTG